MSCMTDSPLKPQFYLPKTTKPFTRNHKTVYLKNDEYLTLHFNHDDFSPIIHRLKQKVI